MSDQDPPDGGGSDSNTTLRQRKNKPEARKPDATGPQNSPQNPATEVTNQADAGVLPAAGQLNPQILPQDILYFPANRIIFAVPKWLAFGCLIIVSVVFIAGGGYIGDFVYKKYYSPVNNYDAEAGVVVSIGEAAVNLFKQYDRDEDGKLSLEEYEALFHTLSGKDFNLTYVPDILQPIEEGDELVTIAANYKPLLLETMTKDLSESYESGRRLDSLHGLKTWNTTATEWRNFGVKHFECFLPPDDTHIFELGKAYPIYALNPGWFSSSILSSNRYFPPPVEDRLLVIHNMLAMFQKRPFLRTRFPAQGATACVRAVNDLYLDIVFRIHAEFQLNEPPNYPFWFTPGQFTGNMIITRDYKRILYFHMYVPTDKKLNTDMEWLNGPVEGENMEVDIGYLPEMSLSTTAESIKVQDDVPKREFKVGVDAKLKERVDKIQWTNEITQEEARTKLEVYMYPFKKVEYHNFTKAFNKAKDEKKLVHSILLWGALDDQSC